MKTRSYVLSLLLAVLPSAHASPLCEVFLRVSGAVAYTLGASETEPTSRAQLKETLQQALNRLTAHGLGDPAGDVLEGGLVPPGQTNPSDSPEVASLRALVQRLESESVVYLHLAGKEDFWVFAEALHEATWDPPRINPLATSSAIVVEAPMGVNVVGRARRHFSQALARVVMVADAGQEVFAYDSKNETLSVEQATPETTVQLKRTGSWLLIPMGKPSAPHAVSTVIVREGRNLVVYVVTRRETVAAGQSLHDLIGKLVGTPPSLPEAPHGQMISAYPSLPERVRVELQRLRDHASQEPAEDGETSGDD